MLVNLIYFSLGECLLNCDSNPEMGFEIELELNQIAERKLSNHFRSSLSCHFSVQITSK